MTNFRRVVLATFAVLSLSAMLAWGQEGPAAPDNGSQADPPGRVARLQYLTGSVSVQPQGQGDWVEGVMNRPLTNADNVWTDKESKAELNVGGGDLRLNSESSLTLTNVNNQSVQVELHQGTLNLHVHQLFGGEIYEVDTPNVAFTVQKAGDYRFDVDPNADSTVVTVRKGEGDATGGGPGLRIKSNEQVSFNNGTSLEHTVAEAPPYDGFDSWCGTRSDREDRSLSAQYVAPGVVGVEDLDDNGVWQEVPTYGHIWVPTHVAAGWAPYRYGHWAYVAPWGWTWVDDASWGFAPFHYGRWVYYGGAWGWAPGPVYVAPVYAPALVAWFGGPSWGVSIGFGGGFGWCPLGWGEPFYPWYHHGYGYFRSVNISNTRITNINNYYGHPPNRAEQFANFRNPGAVTAVPTRTLQQGLPVQRTAYNVRAEQFKGATLNHPGSLQPERGAFGMARAYAPATHSFSQPVVSRTNASFNAGHTPAMQANNGQYRGGTPAPQRNLGSTIGNNGAPAHFVPRPPSAENRAAPNMAMNRQPEMRGSETPNRGFSSPTNNGPSNSGFQQHNVPRPPAGMSRSPESGAVNSGHAGLQPAIQTNRGGSVPRPTGPVRPASEVGRSYGSNASENRGNYGGNYGSAPHYTAPTYRNEGAYRSQPAQHYSAPSYRESAPAYHGGGGSSAPSYHGGGYSAPSYHGGGGGYSAPSSHGGGGGGGGSHSSGGGGGHSGHR
jgi:hypothetical protein